jgi:hypothetical protein
MHQQFGESGIRFAHSRAPEHPGNAFRNLDCVCLCLHQSTLIITAFACQREYVMGTGARLD